MILIVTGTATFYAPELMPAVVEQRVEWGQLEPGLPGLALLDCSWIGERVWLSLPWGQEGPFKEEPFKEEPFKEEPFKEGPFVVADCAQGHHRDMLRKLDWAVDIGYNEWERWHIPRRPLQGVGVWWVPPKGAPRWN